MQKKKKKKEAVVPGKVGVWGMGWSGVGVG